MIQVCERHDREGIVLRELLEQEHQGNRVRSARESNEQPATGRAEPVLLDRSANLVMKSAQVNSDLPFDSLRSCWRACQP